MKTHAIVVSSLALAVVAGTAQAQFFVQNRLAITQIETVNASGDLVTPANSASRVRVREFRRDGTASGTEVLAGSSIPGSRLTMSGTATSEGAITLSAAAGQGRYLSFAGYDAAATTSGVASTLNNDAAGTGPTRRVVGQIDTWSGAVTYANYGQTYSGNNIRSAVFDEINNVNIISGPSATGVSGIRSGAAAGGTSTTGLSGTAANFRNVNIFNGQVFASSASGAVNFGVALISGGTATLLPGLPSATGPSPYDFFFSNDRTLYIADDRTTTSGGLQKWVRTGGVANDTVSGTWTLSTTFNLANIAGTGNAGLRGLAGEVVGGAVNLFAISTDNRLVTITDGVGIPSFTVLATAPTNTNWRGVEIIPTPGTAALLTLGGLLASWRRRSN